MALLATVRTTIAAHQLFPSRARLVVAVSGGADSVALLHLLTQRHIGWQFALHVAHLDHGLRPDSCHDAAFVNDLATQWRLPSTIERRDVRACCAKAGWSIEDGARRIRYQFLQDVARRHSAPFIAVAHTADDQAETVLLRLVRGTGLMGLSAIPIRRPLDELWVVRPLLHVWRQDILAYLQEAGLTYRDDATNANPHFVRNRIRHELLPMLEDRFNPNIRHALTQLAEQSQWDYTFLSSAAQRQWKRLAKTSKAPHIAMAVAPFLRQPKALQRQLVRETMQRVRGNLNQFEFRHWLEVERLFTDRPAGTIVDLPDGIQWRRERDRVICYRRSVPPTATLVD